MEQHDLGTRAARCGTELLNKMKWAILIFWLLTVCFGVWLGPKFLKNTSNTFNAPEGSSAKINEDLFLETFNIQKTASLVIFIKMTDNTSIIDPATEPSLVNFSLSLNNTIRSFPDCDRCVSSFVGYGVFKAMGFPQLVLDGFISPDKTSTVLQLQLNYSLSNPKAVEYAIFLDNEITRLNPKGVNWTVALTGLPAFIPVMQSGIERDLALMDGIVLPLALLILAFILRSLRLLIIPLCCMGISAMASFMIMYGVTFLMEIISVAPSIMMSLMVAMSIDYSLFLLSRYREELLDIDTISPYEAVEIMLRTAGHTIFVSGVTLACCFIGLTAISISLMQALAVSCSITLFVVLLVNITFVPSVLLAFPDFFSRSVEPFSFCGYYTIYWGSNQEDGPSSDEPPPSFAELTRPNPNQPVGESVDSPGWYNLGKTMLTLPWNFIIIAIVVGLVVPFSIYAYPFQTSNSMDMMLPSGAATTIAYQQLAKDFGLGTLYPYQLLFIPPSKNITDQAFFGHVGDVVDEFVQHLPGNVTKKAFSGYTYAQGVNTWDILQHCESIIFKQFCAVLHYIKPTFVNQDDSATTLVLTLPFDPLGDFGKEWYFQATDLAKNLSLEKNISITLSGLPADSSCVVDFVQDHFLIMVGITGAVVLVFVAVAFRSVLLPLRSVLTITLTVAWVYGFADLVYQHGIFDFMHFQGLHGYGALHWSAPVLSFSVVVGLGLDYDVFLLTRIKELRDLGYSTKDAIALGLSKTGHIITAAGIIMAIAFCGLIFSHVPLMNMFSFFMVFAVLFDTFIVRSLVVPALMGFFGDANWWPGGAPPISDRVDIEPLMECGPFWAPPWRQEPDEEERHLSVN